MAVYLCHHGPVLIPGVMVFASVLFQDTTDMQFTWQCVIRTVLGQARTVIFAHTEAVWSPVPALMLEISAVTPHDRLRLNTSPTDETRGT